MDLGQIDTDQLIEQGADIKVDVRSAAGYGGEAVVALRWDGACHEFALVLQRARWAPQPQGTANRYRCPLRVHG